MTEAVMATRRQIESPLRPYQRNSPQAAARIVALALIADGHVSRAEVDLMRQMKVHEQIGLDSVEWEEVIRGLCDDLSTSGPLAQAGHLSDRTLAWLMSDIDAPAMQQSLLGVCASIVEADEHVSHGESVVLMAALRHWHLGDEHWGLHRELMPGSAPLIDRTRE
jgi:uncharacterized tellurite resistance protein B-like protein